MRVLAYIEEGERRGYRERPTCAQRQRVYDRWAQADPEKRPPEPTHWGWYDLGQHPVADLLWFKAFNDRVLAPQNEASVFSGDRLYNIRLKNRDRTEVWKVMAVLNSTLAHLIVELWGRVSLGEGALDNMRYEAASMLILAPGQITPQLTVALRDNLLSIASRPVRSIFSEVGAKQPEGVSLDSIVSDRRALDRLVMGDILGLTDEEQLAVYQAVVDLVRTRLEKAKSVKGQRPRMKGGVNVDKFVQMVLGKVPVAQLSELYRQVQEGEHALVSLPIFRTSPHLDKTLFGYEVTDGRERLEVPNEAQGRYLVAWALLGLYGEIPMPADESTLAELLPQLESMIKEAGQAIEQYLSSIVDKKLRDQLGREVRRKVRESVIGQVLPKTGTAPSSAIK